MAKWVSIEDAVELLLAHARPVDTEEVLLPELNGRVTAEEICARLPVPAFDRSPYDGYAFRSEDVAEAAPEHPVTLRVPGVLHAGDTADRPLGAGEAYRIMTGAAVPEGADCIIRYEDTEFTDREVRIFEAMEAGTNVIRRGEEVSEGTRLIPAGTRLTPALLGMLSLQGIDRCLVYRRPRAAVVSTGSELTVPGNPLLPGHIYESNGAVIAGTLEKLGYEVTERRVIEDDAALIAGTLRSLMPENDVVITTGGASVGDKDFAETALEQAGMDPLFTGVRITPGSCTLAGAGEGSAGDVPVFSLSGNPGAALVSLLVICLPALKKISGRSDVLPEKIRLPLLVPCRKISDSDRLLRGRFAFRDEKVWFAENGYQKSGMLRSFLEMELFARIPADSGYLPEGTMVDAYRVLL